MAAGIYIALGSNIEPEVNVRAALLGLRDEVRILALSTIYASEALGRPGQPRFLNAVVRVETPIEPWELKYGILRPLEERLGRRRTEDRYAPRTIDLDLLLHGDQVIDRPGLCLPDPDIAGRPFLAIPLYELAPDLLLPGSGGRLREVVAGLISQALEPLPALTAALRRELALI